MKDEEPIEDDEPFITFEELSEEEATAYLTEAAEPYLETFKREDDIDRFCGLAVIMNGYNPREVDGVIRWLRRYKAEEVGVQDRTMRNWQRRHGFGVFVNDDRLARILVNRQRVNKKTRVWIRAHYAAKRSARE